MIISIALNIADGILPIDTYKKDVDELGDFKLKYDWDTLRAMTSRNTGYGTAHCPHRCLQRAVPLCRTQQMVSSHLEDTCPLRKAKKGLLSRLFHSILH